MNRSSTHTFPRIVPRGAIWLALLLSAVLAGCATAPPTSPTTQPGATASAQVDTAQTPAPRAPRAAVVPAGPLTELSVRNPTGGPEVATLAAPADLWERIRRGFALPDLDTDLVRDREQDRKSVV